jgi:transposase-like protein
VDETYVRARGEWRHLYRAIDKHGTSTTSAPALNPGRFMEVAANLRPSCTPKGVPLVHVDNG